MRETITIRPTIAKAELQKLSGGNLNKWINGLIERAVGERDAGWEEFMDSPRRSFPSRADEVRKAGRWTSRTPIGCKRCPELDADGRKTLARLKG